MLLSTILAAVISLTPSDVPNPDNWHLNRGDYKSNGVWYAQEPQPEPPRPPQSFDAGIETPVLVLQTVDGKGVGVVADGLDLIVYLDHESPRDPVAIAARIAAEKAKRDLLRLDLRGVRTNLVAVIDLTNTNIVDCQAIKAATTNVTNAAQGKQISDLAGEAVDTNRRLKDLAQELQNLRAIVRDLLKGSD
jgi:hypothetical protein